MIEYLVPAMIDDAGDGLMIFEDTGMEYGYSYTSIWYRHIPNYFDRTFFDSFNIFCLN